MEYFLRFDLAGLEGAVLESATLELTKHAASLSEEEQAEYDPEDDGVLAYEISADWSMEPAAPNALTRAWINEKLAPLRLLGAVDNVGPTGVAQFDVTEVLLKAGRAADGQYAFRVRAAGSRRRTTAHCGRGSSRCANTLYAARSNALAPPRLRIHRR